MAVLLAQPGVFQGYRRGHQTLHHRHIHEYLQQTCAYQYENRTIRQLRPHGRHRLLLHCRNSCVDISVQSYPQSVAEQGGGNLHRQHPISCRKRLHQCSHVHYARSNALSCITFNTAAEQRTVAVSRSHRHRSCVCPTSRFLLLSSANHADIPVAP